MVYRKEIDGLRALAVVPVILFHAGIESFSGGFVGVDVFFVISGFLITSIIASDLDTGTFSIARFYERRARRILPALFLVMLTSIPFAWLLLPAPEMKDFAQSLAAVSLFSSNILFWRESGYFDTAAEIKPLLHTWSLAVEEQYYVFFPLFLTLAWRFGRRAVLYMFIVAWLGSLALAQWGTAVQPTAAFFLLPTRGWELLTGAIASIYLHHEAPRPISRGIRETAATLGLALIVYAVFAFDRHTKVPGVQALVPTIGTALIIVFANNKTAVAKILSSQPLVATGLISYSAYLWHQPVFAFFRRATQGNPGLTASLCLAAVALIAGYISWKFVETPFRKKERVSARKIAVFSALGTIFFLGAGFAGHVKNGFAVPVTNHPPPATKMLQSDLIVLGDSHAAHLVSGLSQITSGKVIDYSNDGCVPLRNVDRYDNRFPRGACVSKMNALLDGIVRDDPPANVVMSFMGPVYFDGTTFNGKDPARVQGLVVEWTTDRTLKDKWAIFESALRTTFDEWSNLKNAKLIFALDVPELGLDYGCQKVSKEWQAGPLLLKDLVVNPPQESCHVSRQAYEDRVRRYRDAVNRVISGYPQVKLFDPCRFFCDDQTCAGFHQEYGYLYRDVDHLSDNGSLFYATNLAEFLRAP